MPNPVAAMDDAIAYSINDAARVLGVKRDTIYGLINQGRLGSVKLGHRRLIPRSALLALVEELERQAAS